MELPAAIMCRLLLLLPPLLPGIIIPPPLPFRRRLPRSHRSTSQITMNNKRTDRCGRRRRSLKQKVLQSLEEQQRRLLLLLRRWCETSIHRRFSSAGGVASCRRSAHNNSGTAGAPRKRGAVRTPAGFGSVFGSPTALFRNGSDGLQTSNSWQATRMSGHGASQIASDVRRSLRISAHRSCASSAGPSSSARWRNLLSGLSSRSLGVPAAAQGNKSQHNCLESRCSMFSTVEEEVFVCLEGLCMASGCNSQSDTPAGADCAARPD